MASNWSRLKKFLLIVILFIKNMQQQGKYGVPVREKVIK